MTHNITWYDNAGRTRTTAIEAESKTEAIAKLKKQEKRKFKNIKGE
jgi:type II secretory pathway component PulF